MAKSTLSAIFFAVTMSCLFGLLVWYSSGSAGDVHFPTFSELSVRFAAMPDVSASFREFVSACDRFVQTFQFPLDRIDWSDILSILTGFGEFIISCFKAFIPLFDCVVKFLAFVTKFFVGAIHIIFA